MARSVNKNTTATKRAAKKVAPGVKKPRTTSPALAPHGKKDVPVRDCSYYAIVDPIKIPEPYWERFLDELRDRGHVGASCRAAGIKRITVYKRRETDKSFAMRMAEAHLIGLEKLKDEAYRRAYKGYKRPVYGKEGLLGHERVYSDRLLEFMLTNNFDQYKRRQEVTGKDGAPLFDLAKLDEEGLARALDEKNAELAALRETLTKAGITE